MANNIILRDAQRSDIDQLVEFNRAHAAEVEDKGLNTNTLKRGIAHLLDEPRDGFYIIAERVGRTPQAVGTLMVTKEWSDWRNAFFWWIQSVYVAPQFRRSGVYSAMHQEVSTRARAGGACGLRLYVEKDNTGAQAVYRRHDMDNSDYLMFEADWT